MKTTPDEISFSEDVLDSRDIQSRIDWLDEQILDIEDDINDAKHDGEEVPDEWVTDRDEYQEELDGLQSFKDNVDSSEWEDGLTLINRDYWQEYVEELCEELGYVSDDLPNFIRSNIDWEAVADELEADYSTADIEGEQFLYRNC
jgi:hypothetical protein